MLFAHGEDDAIDADFDRPGVSGQIYRDETVVAVRSRVEVQVVRGERRSDRVGKEAARYGNRATVFLHVRNRVAEHTRCVVVVRDHEGRAIAPRLAGRLLVSCAKQPVVLLPLTNAKTLLMYLYEAIHCLPQKMTLPHPIS